MTAEAEDFEIKTEDESDEDDVSVTYDIATYPSDFTLSGIAQMWRDKDIVIPDFQREFVWSKKQASLLIDSFLCGLPVPSVFFYIDDDNKNLVIDGQQRILSSVYFFEGLFGEESTHGKRDVFRLTGLDPKSKYHNKKFDELDEADQRKLKQTVLRAVNIRQLSPVDSNTSAYHIFERLNTGGTPLKPQEIRNCVFRGELCNKFKELNKDSNWRKILGKSTLDKHNKDVEIILRLFSLMDDIENYEKPMKEFLNKAMKKNQNGDTDKYKNFIDFFPRVTELVVSKFGEKPFHLRGPINISALDSVMCILLENYNSVDASELYEKFSQLKNDERFKDLTVISTTDTSVIQDRFKLVKNALVD